MRHNIPSSIIYYPCTVVIILQKLQSRYFPRTKLILNLHHALLHFVNPELARNMATKRSSYLHLKPSIHVNEGQLGRLCTRLGINTFVRHPCYETRLQTSSPLPSNLAMPPFHWYMARSTTEFKAAVRSSIASCPRGTTCDPL